MADTGKLLGRVITQDSAGNLGGGSYGTYTSTTANDQDKTITVPANYKWVVKSIYADYTPGSTGGARYVEASYTDASNNVIARSTTSTTLVKGTRRYIQFAPGNPNSVGSGSQVYAPMPEGVLDAGDKIRVRGVSGVGTDDLTIAINYISSKK